MAKKISPAKPTSSKQRAGSPAAPGKRKTWLSFFDRSAVWEDKDEVLDAVYWFRQVLAILMGFVWGLLGLTGILAIGTFIALNSIAAYGVANNTGYEFDPDENFSSVKEGFMATFASFLVTWIITYTTVHFDTVV